MRSTTFLALLGTSLLPAMVQAHGLLVDPKPTFVNPNSDTTTYSATIDGNVVLPGENYNLSPQDNTNAFTRQFKKSSYSTLKALIDAQGNTGGECGLTRADGTPQALPSDSKIKWGHGSEGFVSSHEGPCEVWCDSTRVYQNDNCARNIPNGVMPIDATKCQGAQKLVMLWLALHTSQWQVYKNCVRLSSSGPSPPTSASPTVTPRPSSPPTKKPSPPSPTYSPAPPTYSPAPPTNSPAPPTYSPAPPTNSPAPPTYSPVPPTTSPSGGEAQAWQQCGGKNFNGPTRCVAQYACVWRNDWYSQCIPSTPSPVAAVDTWGQCGGKSYSGATQCKPSDSCVYRNEWYSQCVPRA